MKTMHAIWKGSISFGLINIPVQLFSASHDRELKFTLLHAKDHAKIHYNRICDADGKEVPYEEIVKGYEIQKGHYVVLTEEDFKKANLEKTSTIEIVQFAEEADVDAIYCERPYLLQPEKKASKAYVILREALKRSKKVAIARYVLHHHERLGMIKAHGDALILIQMRLQSELTLPKKLELPKEGSKEEVGMALALIDKLTKPFHPEKFKDTYVEDLKKIIAQKAKKKKVTAKGRAARPSKVQDITTLLKASLEKRRAAR